MDFASKYVLLDQEEEEEVEVGGGLQYSDDECDDDAFGTAMEVDGASLGEVMDRAEAVAMPPPPAPLAAAAAPPPPRFRPTKKLRRQYRRKVQKAGTNVVALHLGKMLSDNAAIQTGDPTLCCQCHAIFSHTSKLRPCEGEEELEARVWECEFCGAENHTLMYEEEIPEGESNDYIINENVDSTLRDSAGSGEASAGLTIFCVDTSGSMCVTTEVRGGEKLRGHDRVREELKGIRTDGSDQRMPGERDDVTYVSRLQAVQAAVDAQIRGIRKRCEKKAAGAATSTAGAGGAGASVGLVTFANEVTVEGDGDRAGVTIAGDKLGEYAKIEESVKGLKFESDVSETADKLCRKVFALEEGGATALGPALLAAVTMASGVRGSKVVLCTDGMANVGVGALEDKSEEELSGEVQAFYDAVAAAACAAGVEVSVVSIKGTDCRLEYVGSVADRTGGNVTIVDPLNITKEFANILADEVVATNCVVKFRVHRGLKVVQEADEEGEGENENENENENEGEGGGSEAPAEGTEAAREAKPKKGDDALTVTREIGNVSQSTSTTFQFAVREAFGGEEGGKLPFQVEIRCVRKSDGLQLCRVVTKEQTLTKERTKAESSANVEVLGTHVAQECARFASKGDYSRGRAYGWRNKEYIKSVSAHSPAQRTQYSAWKSNMYELESHMSTAQAAEEEDGLCLSDSEGEEEETSVAVRSAGKEKKLKKLNARRGKRSDAAAQSIIKMKHGRNLFE